VLPDKRSMDAERADARMDARWKRKGSKKSVLRAQGTEQFQIQKRITESYENTIEICAVLVYSMYTSHIGNMTNPSGPLLCTNGRVNSVK